jgi:sugar phosphate isomerase/epimerase
MIRFGFKFANSWLAQPGAAEKLLEESGFSWLEFGAWEAQSPAFLRYLEQIRKSSDPGVSVHCEFMDINLASLVPEVRQAALQVIQRNLLLAVSIGARRAILHGGDTGWLDTFPEDHPAFAGMQFEVLERRQSCMNALEDSFSTLLAEAGSKGIELVVENMYLPWEMLNTPDEMRHFLHDRMLGKLGMNLDFGHSLISGGDPQGYVHSLGKLIRHSHLHDNDGLYDMHLPLGEGILPLAPALPQLVALNPDLVLLLELPLRRLEDFVEGRRRLLAALE